MRNELWVTEAECGTILTRSLKALPVRIRAKRLANISLAPGRVPVLIQKRQSDFALKGPLQERVVFSREKTDIEWKMRPFPATISVREHHDFELVPIRTCVKRRAVQLYVCFVLGVLKFVPKVVDPPIEFTISERLTMFDNFAQLVNFLSLIKSQLWNELKMFFHAVF